MFGNIHQVAKIYIIWDVQQCTTKARPYIQGLTYQLVNYLPNTHSFITFKSIYCGILPINCPSQEDFEYFDDDKNGILTWSEWKLKSG